MCITYRTSLSRERVDGRARRRVETIDNAVTVIEAETAEVTWTAAALRVGCFVKDDDEVTKRVCMVNKTRDWKLEGAYTASLG